MLSVALCTLMGCGQGKGGSDRNQSSDGEAAPIQFSLSGTVLAAEFSGVDSDTNDNQAPASGNNDAEYAQLQGNPSLIGGFVSAEGSGVTSQRFSSSADGEDWFSVTASPGQSIYLNIHKFDTATPSAVDLDLYLYTDDDTSNPVSSSTGTSARESIVIPSKGNFLLRVVAESGISNYTLQIDSSNSTASTHSVSQEFIPGELLVKWKSRPTAQWLNARGLESIDEKSDDRISTHRLARSDFSPAAARIEYLHLTARDSVRRKLHTLAAVKNLQSTGQVEWVEPNYVYRSQLTPNDQYNHLQWHYRQIKLPQAWDITTGNEEVIVAVLDTGVFSQHPDLRDKLIAGYDFVSDVELALDGDGIDADPEDPGDRSLENRSSWHGTHVSGTVGALTDNGDGVSGAGWKTRIMPLRVIGSDGGSTNDVAQAVRYAAGLPNDSGTLPAKRADIINMSFGGTGHSQTLQAAIEDARAAGVIVVAAAGNDGTETEFYPAAMNGVIAVSATDYNGDRAPYSNFGTWVDVAAPGGNMSMDANGDGYGDGVISTHVDEDSTLSANYSFLQGTSMASPHVAAVFALMKGVNRQLSPQDVDALLAQGKLAADVGDAGKDKFFGMGVIDAFMAVQAASGSVTVPVLTAQPESLNFGSTHTALEVEINNTGATGARISGTPVAGAQWISSIQPLQTDGNGLGRYRVSVDRTNLANGTYSGSIRFPVEGSSDFELRANLKVGGSTREGDAGYLYILLLKAGEDTDGDGKPDDINGDGFPDTEIVTQRAMTASGGRYSFEFPAVSPGKYFIAAGSDIDGDGSICGPGEACGMYPTNDFSNPLTISSNQNGVEFVVSYNSDVENGDQQLSTSQSAGIGPLRIRVTDDTSINGP